MNTMSTQTTDVAKNASINAMAKDEVKKISIEEDIATALFPCFSKSHTNETLAELLSIPYLMGKLGLTQTKMYEEVDSLYIDLDQSTLEEQAQKIAKKYQELHGKVEAKRKNQRKKRHHRPEHRLEKKDNNPLTEVNQEIIDKGFAIAKGDRGEQKRAPALSLADLIVFPPLPPLPPRPASPAPSTIAPSESTRPPTPDLEGFEVVKRGRPTPTPTRPSSPVQVPMPIAIALPSPPVQKKGKAEAFAKPQILPTCPNFQTKVQMCKNGAKCKFGRKCTYAHTISEWNPIKCQYGDRCKNGKKCKFIHPNQTKEELYALLN